MSFAHARWALGLLALVALAACGGDNPFDGGRGMDATMDGPDAARDAMPDVPLLGRVCARSADCDDGIDCTDDICGADNRCVNVPRADRCDDHVYCDGTEVCDPRRGCTHGDPVNCNDDFVCTQDRCVETPTAGQPHCQHSPLDRDGDGDPDDHCHALECGDAGVPEPDAGLPTPCWRGADCDDSDPRVSSLAPEICGDHLDNNCNGQVDESPCQRAPNDTCATALDVSAGGSFELDVAPAMHDYNLACAAGTGGRDVVARFHLDAPQDVEVIGSSSTAAVSLALQTVCGSANATDTVDCETGFPATLRRHSVAAGDYYILVSTSGLDVVDLVVNFYDATPAPTNDTCDTALVVPPTGGTYRSDLINATDDISTPCGGIARDLVYTFTIATPQDVTLQLAGARGSYLDLTLARTCARMPDTVRCDSGAQVQFTAHQLPAGQYFVFVESAMPDRFTLQVTMSPPTPPVAGDTCDNPITLTPGTPAMLEGALLQNDYALSCDRSGGDAVLRFDLATRSDVRVDVTGTNPGDFFYAALRDHTCVDTAVESVCLAASAPRMYGLGLDPGTYYAVVKAYNPTDFTVNLATFPPVTVTSVSGNDTCANAFPIPPGRALFQGDTTALRDDYSSPCAGATPGNDAVFSLHLAARSRLTLTTDTTFFHSVWVTQQDRCPGTTPTSTGNTCTFGNHSTLDGTLAAGDYYIYVDGSSGSGGPYSMLVDITPTM